MEENEPQEPYSNTYRQNEAALVVSTHKYSAFCGGAGSGKTFFSLRTMLIRALKAPGTHHLILRKELTAARASIWMQGLPEVMRVCFPGLLEVCHWNNKDSIVTLPNKSVIRLGGASDRKKLEKILGQTQSTIYINECSEVMVELFLFCQTRIRQKSSLVTRIICDLNPTFQSHWVNQMFILHKDKDGMPLADPENYGFLKMNPRDNTHLDEDYLLGLERLPRKMRKRFYDGEFADDAEGALWSMSDINDARVHYKNYRELKNHVKLGLTVVAIDPATTETEESDLTGIVAVGCSVALRDDGREDLYVLADKSMKGKPLEWAFAAIDLYEKTQSDAIVIETNQGGDMAIQTLKSAGFRGKIVGVHASKGKIARAEPIEALYEFGYVHHLDSKELEKLEDEMTSYVRHLLTGKDASPDRMDALVWGMTYLTQNNNHAKHMRRLDPAKFKQTLNKHLRQRHYGNFR